MFLQRMSAQNAETHVKQLVWSLFGDGQEFKVGDVKEQLYFTYKIHCDCADVVGVLEKSVTEKKLIRVVAGNRYKVKVAPTNN